jgi:glycosyltransferase involved in cell wall biosynthesis
LNYLPLHTVQTDMIQTYLPISVVIVTDAWRPQVNGVVRTLEAMAAEMEAMGHRVTFITPDRFRNMPCPTYPEIRLALAGRRSVARMIEAAAPAAIHIATEGPLGLAARRYCMARGIPFTTSFHTRFPEYVNARCRLPVGLGYAMVRWFHRPAAATMVATETLRKELAGRGFGNLVLWTRGVDIEAFRPAPKDFLDAQRPISLYVGRVAVEKSVEDFLRLDIPGTKYVVGDGPQLERLRRTYPEVRFVGAKHGEELARHYAAADVFVFPSRTDTFGNVMLESLACGLPVAAYPVPGPIDVIDGSGVGVLDFDLKKAVMEALHIPAERCRAFAVAHSWRASAEQFFDNLFPAAREDKAA